MVEDGSKSSVMTIPNRNGFVGLCRKWPRLRRVFLDNNPYLTTPGDVRSLQYVLVDAPSRMVMEVRLYKALVALQFPNQETDPQVNMQAFLAKVERVRNTFPTLFDLLRTL